MLSTRVWALWRGYKIILTIFFLIVSANICNYLFTYGIAALKGTVVLNTLPYTGCFVIPLYNIFWVAFANGFAVETLSIGLIVYKSWRIHRLTGIKTPLFSLLLQDGLAHYISLIASKLFLIGAAYAPTTVSAVVLPSAFPFLIVALVVNRLFLRLRRTMLHQTSGVTDYTTVGFSAIGHSTSGGKGIATVGGSDRGGRRVIAQRHSDLDGEFFSLGGGDVEMSLSKKDGELHHTASTRCSSTILPTPTRPESLSNVDASASGFKLHHVV
jgi:hypothetical protein